MSVALAASTPVTRPRPLASRAFLYVVLINAVWINASEVFRYFVIVMPMMRAAFPEVENVADMTLPIFLVWGIWDSILVLAVSGAVWIYLDRAGDAARHAFVAATAVWCAIFVILWMGLYNMNLATPNILAVALPLSWVELIIAGLVVLWVRRRVAA